jgi:hypothetical protein
MAFPATYNFAYYQGDRYEFVLRPKQANGQAFNLNGYTGLFTVATARGSTEAVIGEPVSASVDANAGTVTVVIEPEFGTTLTGNSYLYDVEISASASSGSNIFTLVTGTINVTRDITNTYGGS